MTLSGTRDIINLWPDPLERKIKHRNSQRKARPSADAVGKTGAPSRCIAAHRSVSEFVLESALARAEETLPDRQRFGLSAEQWEASGGASAPPRPSPRLAKLLKKPSVFERGTI